jgi:D-serine deaminase-like pyridoxal phosphate-dependent protein
MSETITNKDPWYRITNPDEVYSPALLIWPDRIEDNIRKMIEIAEDPGMLRPHVKTHKMPEIVRLQMKYGITRFKCATIAEAEMVAACGARDVLLAYQPAGPNISRFFELKRRFPGTDISCIADCEDVIRELSANAAGNKTVTAVFLDIDIGMNRTGIAPGKVAVRLYKLITELPGITAGGLHVYDGHIHEKELSLRRKICDEAYKPVTSMIEEISRSTDHPVRVVAGGTPTFPIHASRKGVETSPGTPLLWDYGYSTSFTDLNFLHSAVLFTRVISKPSEDLICIDLGHKAVASEMPQPRIFLPEIDNYDIIAHNEEHMVIRTREAGRMKIGSVLYAIPFHICPTVDRYDKVTVIREGKAAEEWKVEARKRQITV